MIKLPKKVLEIRSKKGKLHFQRWRLIEILGRGIFIHHFTRSDKDLHLHDHPWDFYSLVLKGGYVELTKDGTVTRNPGDFGFIAAEKLHQIKSLLTDSSWTLIFRGKRKRVWGYDVDGEWVDNIKYRQRKILNRL